MNVPALRLTHEAQSDVGAVRQVNEDSFVALPEHGLWAVADGMGGLENGQWASGAVVEALSRLSPESDFDAAAAKVAEAIHQANATINAAVRESGHNMGSTAAALMILGRRFAVFWAGDSRVYLLRGGQLFRMTEDHTQVQDMVSRGLLSEEEAAHHPMRHVISRAVGVEPTLELDAVADEVQIDDVFLLCSDGLYGVVSDDEIAQALAVNPVSAARDLVALSLSRGAPDNVTVVTVCCEETTLLMFKSEPA
ncbi:PP2C family protein-serine/threonine phosphatase [Caulobacter sp. KR2-114]|uniref:PP2C family protein-serine/threonine phosphatase n=1 Tax=Caulobacter sp. KR2-114 TaxID=3400912 RepID=UPI003C115AD7